MKPRERGYPNGYEEKTMTIFPELVDLPKEDALKHFFSKIEENYKKGNDPHSMVVAVCEDKDLPFILPFSGSKFQGHALMMFSAMHLEISARAAAAKRNVARIFIVITGLTGPNFGGKVFKTPEEAVSLLLIEMKEEAENVLMGAVIKRDESGDVTELTDHFVRTSKESFAVEMKMS
jgi:hypothetical protein